MPRVVSTVKAEGGRGGGPVIHDWAPLRSINATLSAPRPLHFVPGHGDHSVAMSTSTTPSVKITCRLSASCAPYLRRIVEVNGRLCGWQLSSLLSTSTVSDLYCLQTTLEYPASERTGTILPQFTASRTCPCPAVGVSVLIHRLLHSMRIRVPTSVSWSCPCVHPRRRTKTRRTRN